MVTPIKPWVITTSAFLKALSITTGARLVTSGISAENFETARDGIFAQLEAIKDGRFSEAELDAAKALCIADALAISDSPGALDSFYLVRAGEGSDFSPEESAELLKEVTAEDVREAAEAVECDMIYLLAPAEDAEADDENSDPSEEADPEV